jgi:hypothetical protein
VTIGLDDALPIAHSLDDSGEDRHRIRAGPNTEFVAGSDGEGPPTGDRGACLIGRPQSRAQA